MALQTFSYPYAFPLESGESLPALEVAYMTWGKLNQEHSNVIWICHALTGSADAADWWSGLVGEGKLFDPTTHFIVCANVLGSHYGSTNPLSIDPRTGEPYYHDFPIITIRDIVRTFDLLREHLQIRQIELCVGGSLGGQQALEFAILRPELIQKLILMATNAVMSPWGIAFNESQRMAIATDPTWKERRPDAGLVGMKTARAIALLSYRNYETYALTQQRNRESLREDFRASTYQRYQGEKIAKRFNAFSYNVLTKVMDTHDVSRGRDGIVRTLQQVKARTLVVSISSDVLFPPPEQQGLAKYIPKASYVEIESVYGHDGFLIENEAIMKAINEWEAQYESRVVSV
ncbi:MAG: homoserine O-acetyltransferase [Spirosomataceae bacterium]